MKHVTLYTNTNACADLKFYANLRNSKRTAAILVTCSLFERVNFICKMGRKGALSRAEKFKIVQRIHNKISTLEIPKKFDSDHRIIRKCVTNPELCNGRSEKGKIRKKKAPVSHRAMSRIKSRWRRDGTVMRVHRNPLETSKKFLKTLPFLMYPNQLDTVS